jgi:hypothetical protein
MAQPAEGSGERLFDDGASDWSTSYAQFLSRSAANSQKILKLYQQTLEYVAQGRLPSTVFQEYYPLFIQRHGAGYAERLSQLGAEFLGSLAALSGRDSRMATEDEGEIPVPVFDPSNPARWFEQYAEYAGKLNARALKAYRSQLDQVAAGEQTPADAQQKMAADMSAKLPGYMEESGRLYLEMMSRLDELRGRYEEDYLGGILAIADGAAKAAVTDVVLSAPLGGVAFASFTITNTTGARTPIRYIATEVRRMDGVGSSFTPRVAIVPEVLELGPGEEGTITFSVQMEADRYEVGKSYVGFLYIAGDGDLHVELQLRIVATGAISDKN